MMHTAPAYDQIYSEYETKIRNYFRSRMKNTWDADDLTTTVFIKAFMKLDQYNTNRSFAAWLYAIAHNTLVDHLRKRREYPTDDQFFSDVCIAHGSLPEERLMSKETGRALWTDVQALTYDQYRVISLRYQADMSFQEIARKIGKSESAVKVIQHRAIKQLRKKVKREA